MGPVYAIVARFCLPFFRDTVLLSVDSFAGQPTLQFVDRSKTDRHPHGSASAGRASGLWLCLLLVAAVELLVHAAIRSTVASHRDWEKAAAFVRQHFAPGDAIAVAPDWADPILRWVLGDRISISMAGRSDLAAYGRLWALSIRGAVAQEAEGRNTDMSRRFGRVRVTRSLLPPSGMAFDLVQNLRQARVTLTQRGAQTQCAWRRLGPARGGGLGIGVVPPIERFVCDTRRRWLWVAPVVVEDLHLQPRYCVWQHPAGAEPVRVTYSDVPLADHIVFYGGLYYEHERDLRGAPVRVGIHVNGRSVGAMLHRDGDGWKRVVFPTGQGPHATKTGEIVVEVSCQRPHRRGFCWAASTRHASGARAGAARGSGDGRRRPTGSGQ